MPTMTQTEKLRQMAKAEQAEAEKTREGIGPRTRELGRMIAEEHESSAAADIHRVLKTGRLVPAREAGTEPEGKSGEILEALRDLEGALEDHITSLEMLEGRLEVVLLPPIETPERKRVQRDTVLGRVIGNLTHRVEDLSAAVQALCSRIQL